MTFPDSSHSPFIALAWLLPPIALFAPKGMVPLAVATALLLLAQPSVRRELFSYSRPKNLWPLFPLLAWMAVSFMWTPAPEKAARTWLALIAMVFVGRALWIGATRIDEGCRTVVRRHLGASVAVLILAMVSENLSGGQLMAIVKPMGVNDHLAFLNPGNAIAALFSFVLLAVLPDRPRLFQFAAMAVLGAAVFTGQATTNLLAFLAGISVLALSRWSRRATQWLVATTMATLLLVMPYVVLKIGASEDVHQFVRTALSWQHRWQIWQFVADRIAEFPIFGWGMEASRFIPGGHGLIQGGFGEKLPLHPHNSMLQIWLELGAVGAFAAALFTASIPFRLPGTAQLAIASCAFVFFALSYGAWQNWWLASILICLAMARAARQPETRAVPDGPRPSHPRSESDGAGRTGAAR